MDRTTGGVPAAADPGAPSPLRPEGGGGGVSIAPLSTLVVSRSLWFGVPAFTDPPIPTLGFGPYPAYYGIRVPR